MAIVVGGGEPQLPVASVVIPAHDEAQVIATCLQTLLADAERGEFEVVVVCNGCSDDTAAIARRTGRALGHPIWVIELAEASKPAALRAGDLAASAFPRLYLDADSRCPTASARALSAALGRHRVELSVPARVLDLRSASALARLYHRTWAGLPWVVQQLAGRGAFAISLAGRGRFGPFPDVIADDRWATTRVPTERARIVDDAPVTVTPPGKLADVVRVRSRVFVGNETLDGRAHDATASQRSAFLLRGAVRPTSWPGLGVFVTVTVLAKALAWYRLRSGRTGWSRASRDSARRAA